MKGNFHVSMEYLRSTNISETGEMGRMLESLAFDYPDGGEYQEILDHFCEYGKSNWAVWLMEHLGITDDIREYGDNVDDINLAIVFAGSIRIERGATVKKIHAGGSIKARGNINTIEGIISGNQISVDGAIISGWCIRSGNGISARRYIIAGSHITANGDVIAKEGIKAGWGIHAAGDVKTGGYINSGNGIRSGGDVKSGDGFGIFAGLTVSMPDWHKDAKVISKIKPRNLISGQWVDLKSNE